MRGPRDPFDPVAWRAICDRARNGRRLYSDELPPALAPYLWPHKGALGEQLARARERLLSFRPGRGWVLLPTWKEELRLRLQRPLFPSLTRHGELK